MKRIRTLIITYFFKPYYKNFTILLTKINPLINIFKYLYNLRIILILLSIWRLHGFMYTFASFFISSSIRI